MGNIRHTKVLIVGSGPAGYTAGVYASRAMLEPLLIQGIEPGGRNSARWSARVSGAASRHGDKAC